MVVVSIFCINFILIIWHSYFMVDPMKISFLGCLQGGVHTLRWAFFISPCVLVVSSYFKVDLTKIENLFHEIQTSDLLFVIEVVQLNFGGLQARNL